MCMGCLHVCVQVSADSRVPWRLPQVVSHTIWVLELTSGPFQDQYIFLTLSHLSSPEFSLIADDFISAFQVLTCSHVLLCLILFLIILAKTVFITTVLVTFFLL